MKPKCIILVGPQCSGKSTLSKYLGYHTISNDKVIMMNSVDYRDGYTKADRGYIAEMVRNEILMMISERKDFIVDNMNLTYKSRHRTLCRFNKKEYAMYGKICVVMPFPDKETFKLRNENRRNKYIKESVYDDCLLSYQKPSYSEGFDHIIFLKYIHDPMV